MANYYFAVQNMGHRPDATERVTRRGFWFPSRRLGYNISTFTRFFHHTPNSTECVTGVPQGSVPWKSFSLYHLRGKLVHVNLNATRQKIGTGRDDNRSPTPKSGSSDEDDDDVIRYYDWEELSFDTVPESPRCHLASYAGHRREHPRLRVRRPAQEWVQHFLPDRYHPEQVLQADQGGGMIGELPLLIAIAAMSQPPAQWETLLPETVAGTRIQLSQSQRANIERGSACKCNNRQCCRKSVHSLQAGREGKGVVVTIFTIPTGTRPADLERLERGHWGPILA